MCEYVVNFYINEPIMWFSIQKQFHLDIVTKLSHKNTWIIYTVCNYVTGFGGATKLEFFSIIFEYNYMKIR